MQLPINEGNWDDKYGEFSDISLVEDTLKAMKKVQGLSVQFGNPTSIQAKLAQDGGYLTNLEPPSEIYGHIIWLASQIQNAASTPVHITIHFWLSRIFCILEWGQKRSVQSILGKF